MTQRRFLARGKAVAFALASAPVFAATPAMAGPAAAAVVSPICIIMPWLCPIVPLVAVLPTP